MVLLIIMVYITLTTPVIITYQLPFAIFVSYLYHHNNYHHHHCIFLIIVITFVIIVMAIICHCHHRHSHCHHYHRCHQGFLRGGQLKGRESSSAEGSSKLGGHVSMRLCLSMRSPRNFCQIYSCRGELRAYLVKDGDKSLEDKNNSNEIILLRFFKRDFPLLDVQKRGRSTPSSRRL